MMLLSLDGITKRFPGATALEGVGLALEAGKVHALAGENGAGKSTLVNIIAGALRPDAGRIVWEGEPIAIDSPRRARQLGIAAVHQEAAVFADLTVAENIALPRGLPTAFGGWVRWAQVRETARQHLAEVGAADISPSRRAGTLSAGQRQLVGVAAALSQQPRVLLLDEPTASLTAEETRRLHDAIRRLARGGTAVLYVSRRAEEVLEIADTITVLRDGRCVSTRPATEVTRNDLTEEAVAGGAARQKEVIRREWTKWLAVVRAAGLLLALAVVVAFVTTRASGFTSSANLTKLLFDVSLIALAGVGMTVVIVSGGLDISVGSMLALASACSVLAVRAGCPAVGGVAIALGIGLGLGALNGAVSALTRVHPLVVTVGALGLYRWLFLTVLGGQPIREVPAGVRALALAEVLGVQAIVWLAVAIVIAAFVMLRCHTLGRQLFASGGNKRLAATIGIRTRALSVIAFAACGATVGLAAILWAAEYNAIQPCLGKGFELQVIAAAVIGGASISGGVGSVLRTAAAALLVGVMYNGMQFLDIPSDWQAGVFGALVVAAVLSDELLRRLAAGKAA